MMHKPDLLTVCIALKTDRKFQAVREAEINHLIDRLGNPAGNGATQESPQCAADPGMRLQQALAETGRIHFCSLILIPASGPREPAWLVLELSGDGRPKELIEIFVDAAGEIIMPVFQRACETSSVRALRQLLNRHRKQLHQRIPAIPLRPGDCTGAGFIGGPGLSVAQIRADRKLADFAEQAVGYAGRHRATNGISLPLQMLEAVRDHIFERGNDPLGLGDHDPVSEKHSFDALNDADIRAGLRDMLEGEPPEPIAPGKPANADSSPVALIPVAFHVWLALFALAVFCVAVATLSGNLLIRLPGALVIAATVSVLFAAISVVIAGLVLQRSEKRNLPRDLDPDPETLREISARENQGVGVQNHMVSVTTVLAEPFRKHIALPGAFAVVVNAIRKGHFAPGLLSDIGSIHFARWIVLPGTNRLVFFSNYDGNWEGYLEDFISRASEGLTGIWSNCEGFPQTRQLFFGGADDGDRFKRWARRSMIATRFWFSAYPDLDMARIRRNARIRDGLYHIAGDSSAAQAWLDLFDSSVRPSQRLETTDMQCILLKGLRHHTHSASLVVSFPPGADKGKLREWLADLTQTVSFGQDALPDRVLGAAFTASGLARLGLDTEVSTGANIASQDPERRRFPAAFSSGMADPARQRILGDTGDSSPDHWEWGGDGQAHALLMLYARASGDTGTHLSAEKNLAGFIEAQKARLGRAGITCLRQIDMQPLPARGDAILEPFGYVDGISQPRIRGLGRAGAGPEHDCVAPGEFILGYKDNRGYFPPSLPVPATSDSQHNLSVMAVDLPIDAPAFGPSTRATSRPQYRDFGRNGSFLVVRQLEQNVGGFRDWVRTQAGQLQADETCPIAAVSEERIYAKVMGRWRSGHPLALYPAQPGPQPAMHSATPGPFALRDTSLENNFLHGRDDPQGHACPFGAHIRRAGPRDSFAPERSDTIQTSNRHRLLRRGRTFQQRSEDGKIARQGTFFMCFNGDLERQFEFVQQNWINSQAFHGLTDEVDPVAGQFSGAGAGSRPYHDITLPSERGPDRLTNWQSFIEMRGGAYFFLPARRALRYLAALSE